MHQTYFEWYEYEFDVNVVLIVITTCAYKSTNVLSTNESEEIIKFQYC